MDSKVITLRVNEFDQEYLELAKQIVYESSDFYAVDNSFIIKLAIKKFIDNSLSDNKKLEELFLEQWRDLEKRHIDYLLSK